MAGRTIYGQALSGCDVIAALVRLGVALGLVWLQPSTSGLQILWIGGPASAILARRRWLPQLSATREASTSPPTLGRRVAGYALMIFGGFVVFIDGIFLWATLSARAPLPLAAGLGVLAIAGWITSLGFRRVA